MLKIVQKILFAKDIQNCVDQQSSYVIVVINTNQRSESKT